MKTKKEPIGVDFIIQSDPLTDDERKAISEFIRKDKQKNIAKNNSDNKLFLAKKEKKAA